jgi:hypothetical protein
MQFWIEHPATENPVSFGRWVRWKLSELFGRWHRSLEREALYPYCESCGQPRRRGDHSKCDEIPF